MTEEIVIDFEQCTKIVKLLDEHFTSQKALAEVEYPLNIKKDSIQYILYMFYSCLLDYGMRSKIYHKNLIETYEKFPNIFDPNEVVKMEENTLLNIIKNNIHPRYPNIAVKKWFDLSKTLIEYDDILGTLKSLNSVEELTSFIKNIKGYGQKTGGLLIRIIRDSNICSFKENIKTIPIDRHDIEISYFTRIISSQKLRIKEIEALSNVFVEIGNKLNIDPSKIDKYLWEIGNSFCNNKLCYRCPLNGCCLKQKGE